MSDASCCALGSGDGESASVWTIKQVKAAKDHRCTECREVIAKGAIYERTKGCWDGSWSEFKTCVVCVEIRGHFSCDENGWDFGSVWSQLADNFFPDMKAGGPCMEGLSPAAKDKLFTRRMKWLMKE